MFLPKAFSEEVVQVLQAFICRAPGCGYDDDALHP